MKKKFFMSTAFMLLLGGVAANAKPVDIYIITSCDEVYHITEIGDTVSEKELVEYVKYIEWSLCG